MKAAAIVLCDRFDRAAAFRALQEEEHAALQALEREWRMKTDAWRTAQAKVTQRTPAPMRPPNKQRATKGRRFTK